MSAIFLIGYMGTGKTTLGKALSERLQAPFIDLDDYIEAKAGMSVSQIFASRGEAGFRALERQALSQVCLLAAECPPQSPAIVACGGGTPCQPGNLEAMNAAGVTVHLTAPVWRLVERLSVDRGKRPILASLSLSQLPGFITEQLALRMPHYSGASATFNSTNLEDEQQIQASVDLFIKQFHL